MGSISGESSVDWDNQDSNAPEEKISVSVRLRPLNERELSKNDVSEWECINTTTLIYKNTFQERSMAPAAYTFDRVYGPDSHTKQVYEESAKKIALSVLSGINSSIFAYGQTSSGKTYTMSGILDHAIEDIYDYMEKHSDREFVLKFSAMEIYNEVVRDLLISESPPLRLLDDPVRGTVVEKLTEVIITDSNHLKEQLAICEAERKIGDTALNEMSSRSHQILGLTVESADREYLGAENSSMLTATVNFVDLAGSERTSQTMSAGTRLKEGCHINRSLLTLGTVIRKLSKGRGGHVPYRDSKLTRILQHSLGGNARTAILCTMSPAHSHVEQSRSTLVFASCAKQISTNAQVNVMMSEKALVQKLRREIGRLENEVKTLSSHISNSDLTPAVKEKEVIIGQLDEEIKNLTNQRDQAESRLETASRLGLSHQSSASSIDLSYDKDAWTDHEYTASEASDVLTDNYEDQFLSDNTSPRLYIEKYFGPQSPDPSWLVQLNNKKNFKDVDCIEIDFTKRNGVASASESSALKHEDNSGPAACSSEEKISNPSEMVTTIKESPATEATVETETTSHANDADDQGGNLSKIEPYEYIKELHGQDSHNSIKSNSINDKEEEIIKTSGEHPEVIKQEELCNDIIIPKGKMLEQFEGEIKSKNPENPENEEPHANVVKPFEDGNKSENPEKAENEEESFIPQIKEVIVPEVVNHSEDETKLKNLEKAAEEEPCVADFNEVITPKVMKQFGDGNTSKSTLNAQDSSNWPAQFERQKKEIIELWDTCHIPLVYRTYFFLLFKGDPSENVYMEVELRRLAFLKKNFEETSCVKDDHTSPEDSSVKALSREREMLSRKMFKKLSRKERRALYEKWGIDLKTKRRRLQVCRRLWTNTADMEHINESAAVVARLVGFKEQENTPKEMIGLSFKP